LLTIAADNKHLGAKIGFIAILHTWGQNLMFHPHLHCVVPGGGLSVDGSSWIKCRNKFFLPVRVLSRLFRRLFLDLLKEAFEHGRLQFHQGSAYLGEANAFERFLKTCRKTEWVVYAKPPFGGANKVLDYLSRYTHRIAISNHRLLEMKDGKVSFLWRDYKQGNRNRIMTLPVEEFIRRFLLHVLPSGFMRIRYYGFLSNRYRAQNLQQCNKLLSVSQDESEEPQTLDWKARYELVTGEAIDLCPLCRQGHLITIQRFRPGQFASQRPPPLKAVS
jgi:hypothetical protein